jgi:hypothetical protein
MLSAGTIKSPSNAKQHRMKGLAMKETARYIAFECKQYMKGLSTTYAFECIVMTVHEGLIY